MMTRGVTVFGCLCTLCFSLSSAADTSQSALAHAEQTYLGLLDAYGAREAIGAGVATQIDGDDRTLWESRFAARRAALTSELQQLKPVSHEDASLVQSLRDGLKEFGGASGSFGGRTCSDAGKSDLDQQSLSEALASCFREIGDRIPFEGREVTRSASLSLLQKIDPSSRRKQLFLAAEPLWIAVNQHDAASSPYRRLIAAAAQDAREHGSYIDAATRSLGWSSKELESALISALEAWRRIAVTTQIEPWDYRFHYAAASRALNSVLPPERVLPITRRFFGDLGADLPHLGVAYDLEPRPGKPPIGYTDFIRIGRVVEGSWQPAKVRVSSSLETGGLFSTDEVVHETAHAVQLMAIRARPAYFWPDKFVGEAFGNVPTWSLYHPAWQAKYLGQAASRTDGRNEQYSLVMLDIAWSLFEIRMLRDPKADPDQVWTEVTSHYLGIKPHPEWSWWAMRVQLVWKPGYMINYGAGAILTADIRARIADAIGPCDTGNPGWYSWVSENLLRFGAQIPPAQLLRQLFGRPPSADALIHDIES